MIFNSIICKIVKIKKCIAKIVRIDKNPHLKKKKKWYPFVPSVGGGFKNSRRAPSPCATSPPPADFDNTTVIFLWSPEHGGGGGGGDYLQQHLYGSRVPLAGRPVHGLGTLDPVTRRVHGDAPGHQVLEHLGVTVERGPVGRRVTPFVPEGQRVAAALFHGRLEPAEVAALDRLQQRPVRLVRGPAYARVQRIGRTPGVHDIVVVRVATAAHHDDCTRAYTAVVPVL